MSTSVRNIATRCRLNGLPYGTPQHALMSRTYHVNKGSDTSLGSGSVQVVYGNWYASSTGEINGGGAFNLFAAIEYPLGVFSLGTFNGGQASGLCNPGATIVSDPISVAIPCNQAFWVHLLMVATGGDITYPVSILQTLGGGNNTYGNTINPPAIENNLWQWTAAQWALNAVDPRKLVTSTTTPTTGQNNNNSTFTTFPLAVISLSSVPSILCIGDSRIRGQKDAVYAAAVTPTAAQPADSATWGTGQCCRAIGFYYPYCNGGIDSDTVTQFNLTHTLRLALQQYYTHMTSNYGTNDIVTKGLNAAAVEAALTTFWSTWSIPTSHQTILPQSTSTDSWATVANQTTNATDGVRVTVNQWLRSKPGSLSAVFDTTRVLESGPESGKWNAPDGIPAAQVPTTLDGIHPSPFGYQLIQYSDVFYPGAFAAEQ